MKKILLAILTVSLLISCSGVKVLNSEASDDFKITRYSTFDFYKLETVGDTTSDFASNILKLNHSIIKQLQLKGLQQSGSDPGLLVNVGIVIDEKIQTRETSKYDAPRYAGTFNYTLSAGEVEVDRYREGTVTVHLVDPTSKKLVWRGAVGGILPSRKSKVPAMIDEGMTALFKKLQ